MDSFRFPLYPTRDHYNPLESIQDSPLTMGSSTSDWVGMEAKESNGSQSNLGICDGSEWGSNGF